MCVNITFVSQVCKTPLALCKRCMSNSMRTSENCGSHLAWSSLTQSDLMSSENRRILRVSKIITTSSEVCWIKKTLNTNLRQTKVSALLVVIHHVKTLLCPSHLTFKQVGHLILLDSKTQSFQKVWSFFFKTSTGAAGVLLGVSVSLSWTKTVQLSWSQSWNVNEFRLKRNEFCWKSLGKKSSKNSLESWSSSFSRAHPDSDLSIDSSCHYWRTCGLHLERLEMVKMSCYCHVTTVCSNVFWAPQARAAGTVLHTWRTWSNVFTTDYGHSQIVIPNTSAAITSYQMYMSTCELFENPSLVSSKRLCSRNSWGIHAHHMVQTYEGNISSWVTSGKNWENAWTCVRLCLSSCKDLLLQGLHKQTNSLRKGQS